MCSEIEGIHSDKVVFPTRGEALEGCVATLPLSQEWVPTAAPVIIEVSKTCVWVSWR